MFWWQRCKEWAVVLFCLWHMAAVSLFVLPYPIASKVKNVTDAYIFALSQWQYWFVFSPEPPEFSSTYRIDLLQPRGTWHAVQTIDYAHLSFFERAKELKVLENLEGKWQVLTPHYLKTFCQALKLQPGNTLRLIAITFVIPKDLESLKHTATLDLPVSERELGSAPCPS